MSFTIAVVILLAWGLFAFGAVYPWAYWPLVVLAVGIGVWGTTMAGLKSGPTTALGIALGVVAVAILAQLAPLSREVLGGVSPTTVTLLDQFHIPFASREIAAHPLSIRPEATRLAMAFFVPFSVLLLGLTRGMSAIGARGVGAGIIIVGVVSALVAIVQRAFFTSRIYGFWTPEQGGNPFGPFVNKNHFAGWMVMALALALGYLGGRLARAMQGVKPGWRERILWWSSPSANKLILVAAAILVMGLSLVLSLSRSGVTCFLLAVLVTGWFVARRQTGGTRKAAGLAYLIFLVVVVLGWAGLDVVASRFAAADWVTLGMRWGAWDDALRVARTFWLTGTGLNTYGAATLFYQEHYLALHFTRAHNDYLQLAAEGGFLVGIPALILIGVFAREVRRRFHEAADDTMTYWLRLGAVTGLLAIAFQEVVEFSLQIPGNAILFTVLAAIAVHRPPAPRRA